VRYFKKMGDFGPLFLLHYIPFIFVFYMSRSKKIFLGFAVVFFVLLFYASYDISSKTTFPGSKPQLKERLKDQLNLKDSLFKDSIPSAHR
jgi:hypothetical protein